MEVKHGAWMKARWEFCEGRRDPQWERSVRHNYGWKNGKGLDAVTVFEWIHGSVGYGKLFVGVFMCWWGMMIMMIMVMCWEGHRTLWLKFRWRRGGWRGHRRVRLGKIWWGLVWALMILMLKYLCSHWASLWVSRVSLWSYDYHKDEVSLATIGLGIVPVLTQWWLFVWHFICAIFVLWILLQLRLAWMKSGHVPLLAVLPDLQPLTLRQKLLY